MIGIEAWDSLAALAKERQRAGGGDQKSASAKTKAYDQKSVPPKSGEAIGEVADQIAADSGAAASTVQQARAITKHGFANLCYKICG